MKRSTLFALLTTLFLSTTAAHAAIKPNGLFNDNAVLQQGVKVPVWGTTDAGGPVSVKVADQEATAMPKDGKWRVELPTLKAGGPFELVITQGDQKVEVKNVLVGEVWLCGGQSNMQWSVKDSADPDKTAQESANDQIRLITIPRKGAKQPEPDVTAAWQVCGPETIVPFSAVAYHFGRELQKTLGVPVGLINSNIGGTTAERWASTEAIAATPELQGMSKPQGANDLYNSMIYPLAPYAIKGAIWYQGESNAGRAQQYRKLLPVMIKSWRDTFGQGDFPFLIVQLAPFKAISAEPIEADWAELRDAQLFTTQSVPATAEAVITDVGDERDIHPKKKGPVGARLALAARALAYGEKMEYSGPVYDKLTVSGKNAVLSFTHVGQGLEVRPLATADADKAKVKPDELAGFTIAGADKKFYNATAKIDGDTVVVSSDQVAEPVAVRYGWANYPVVNLWNKDGLPATPFRTDAFPGVTDGKK